MVSVSHGTFVPGTHKYMDVTNLRQCMEECMTETSCQSADYNHTTSQCVLHANFTHCNVLQKQANVTHLRKEPCGEYCSSLIPGILI